MNPAGAGCALSHAFRRQRLAIDVHRRACASEAHNELRSARTELHRRGRDTPTRPHRRRRSPRGGRPYTAPTDPAPARERGAIVRTRARTGATSGSSHRQGPARLPPGTWPRSDDVWCPAPGGRVKAPRRGHGRPRHAARAWQNARSAGVSPKSARLRKQHGPHRCRADRRAPPETALLALLLHASAARYAHTSRSSKGSPAEGRPSPLGRVSDQTATPSVETASES